MKKMIKDLLLTSIILFISVSIFHFNTVSADDYDDSSTKTDYGVLFSSNIYTVDELSHQFSFTGPSGHAFAAEEGNNLIDVVSGKNSQVVGYDNVKNGPDRLIIERDGTRIFIQDKYYNSAKGTVDACFDESGMFRYFDSSGNPMQIEVPSDQYEQAVSLMKSKISEGKIKGIKDPEMATKIVKKGNLTYEQTKNLAKAGTVESLAYDAVHGCVTAATSFGIATTLDFAIRMLNGEKWSDAIKESSMIGVKTGARAFAITVISGQLTKAGAANVFKPTTDKLIKTFGDDFANSLLRAYGQNQAVKSATAAASKLLQSQLLVSTVTVVVLTAPDVVDLIRGRISAKQLFKDLATATAGVAGGVAGGAAGGAVGTYFVPGVGTKIGIYIGSVAGGAAAGLGAEALLNIFFEDDAEEMLSIVQDEFHNLGVEYLIDENEAEEIANNLATVLNGTKLKDMFASEDRIAFAREMMMPLFEEEIGKRKNIAMPTDEEMRFQLKEELQGVVFIH